MPLQASPALLLPPVAVSFPRLMGALVIRGAVARAGKNDWFFAVVLVVVRVEVFFPVAKRQCAGQEAKRTEREQSDEAPGEGIGSRERF